MNIYFSSLISGVIDHYEIWSQESQCCISDWLDEQNLIELVVENNTPQDWFIKVIVRKD